jgi:hypothetical protein
MVRSMKRDKKAKVDLGFVIPTVNQFIKEIFLVDVEQITDKINQYITKQRTDKIYFLGSELIQRRKDLEKL